MLKWIVWFPLKVLAWALGFVGFIALALTAMVATPLPALPELTSISKSARRMFLSACCATRQVMNAIAPAISRGVLGRSFLNQWLRTRIMAGVDAPGSCQSRPRMALCSTKTPQPRWRSPPSPRA